jgi:phosphoglycerate dehydrogenase-like enzyme
MTVLTILNSPGTEIPALITDLGERDGIELRIAEASTLSQALPGTDVLLMWDFFSTALKDAYGSADRLEWVHAAAAGVDSLLFDELVDSPVTVTNARGIFDRPIAEFVLSYILMHAKSSIGSLDDQAAKTVEPPVDPRYRRHQGSHRRHRSDRPGHRPPAEGRRHRRHRSRIARPQRRRRLR